MTAQTQEFCWLEQVKDPMMLRYCALAMAALATWLLSTAAMAQEFAPCSDADAFPALAGSLCATAEVPLQPGVSASPDETLSLFVRKFPAANARKRRGQVWLVAGGPGESGASLYPVLPTLRQAFAGYDLIFPDHRGTGYSSKLCPDQEAPGSAGGIALAGEEWGPCIGALHGNVARTHSFTITNAAHDLAALIRRYRSRGKVQLYGVSYGTQLVLRMMQVAPVRLDGIILDGLVPPETASEWDLSRRTAVVDAVGRQLLNADQTQQYRELLAQQQPGWLASVPGGDLRRLMGSMLTFPEVRDRIPQMIEALANNDSAPLISAISDVRALSAQLSVYPQSPPSLPLVMLISGSENNARPDLTADIVAAESGDSLFTSSLPGLLVGSPAPLYQRDEFYGTVPQKLPRTLVVHGTLDPNTPYEGALAHTKLLAPAGDVHFVTVDRGAHFLALVAPKCFAGTVSAFVSRGELRRDCASG